MVDYTITVDARLWDVIEAALRTHIDKCVDRRRLHRDGEVYTKYSYHQFVCEQLLEANRVKEN